ARDQSSDRSSSAEREPLHCCARRPLPHLSDGPRPRETCGGSHRHTSHSSGTRTNLRQCFGSTPAAHFRNAVAVPSRLGSAGFGLPRATISTASPTAMGIPNKAAQTLRITASPRTKGNAPGGINQGRQAKGENLGGEVWPRTEGRGGATSGRPGVAKNVTRLPTGIRVHTQW